MLPDIETSLQAELTAANARITELEGEIRNWMKAFATFRLGLRSTLSQYGIRSNPGWSDGDFEAAIDQLGNERDGEKARAAAAEKERDILAYTLTRTQAQIHAMADAAGVLAAHQYGEHSYEPLARLAALGERANAAEQQVKEAAKAIRLKVADNDKWRAEWLKDWQTNSDRTYREYAERIIEGYSRENDGLNDALVLLESEQETADIQADPDLMAAIESSEADIAAGRVIPWEDVKKELGLDTEPPVVASTDAASGPYRVGIGSKDGKSNFYIVHRYDDEVEISRSDHAIDALRIADALNMRNYMAAKIETLSGLLSEVLAWNDGNWPVGTEPPDIVATLERIRAALKEKAGV